MGKCAAMKKPVRLELNNSGSWKLLGFFDAADDDQASLVMDAAEDLVKTLHNGAPARLCPTLRVTLSEAMVVLLRWEIERGWYDAQTGEPV